MHNIPYSYDLCCDKSVVVMPFDVHLSNMLLVSFV